MTPRPLITHLDRIIVDRQLASMWLGRGRRVLELEQRMAAWVGAKYAAAFGSGTAALTVALMNEQRRRRVNVPDIDCEALHAAVRAADMVEGIDTELSITLYPERGAFIEDFARHLPRESETRLIGRFGVFSFGALKDVTGGIGGCLVSHAPFDVGDWRMLSPLSDINAALILSQLNRYTGHTRLRAVAEGKIWESPA